MTKSKEIISGNQTKSKEITPFSYSEQTNSAGFVYRG